MTISIITRAEEPLTPYYLWAAGDNAYGQFGDYMPVSYVTNIFQVGSETIWASAAGGGNTIALLDGNGTLYVSGDGNYGQLGNGLNGSSNRISWPLQVGEEGDWVKITAGQYSFMGIKTDGTLWAWGYNFRSQFGLGDNINRSSPVQVGTDEDWAFIQTTEVSAAIKTDGTLWTSGNASNGGLGRITTPTPSNEFGQVGTDEDWYKVAMGTAHGVALKTNGELWVWGAGATGRLGLGDTVNRSSPEQVGSDTDWAEVAAISSSSMAIKTDGTLWGWGSNTSGYIGIEDKINRSSPTQVGSLTDWSKISGGQGYFIALKTDGTLWAWGSNSYGQLSTDDRSARSSPVQIGSDTSWISIRGNGISSKSTLAISTTGTITGTYVWGSNNYGELGLDHRDTISSPVMLGDENDWEWAYVSSRCGSYIKADGTLWTCGDGGYFALGFDVDVNISSPTQVGTDTDWVEAYCGYYSAHGLKTDGSLYMWGDNDYGQLGFGDRTARSSPTQLGSDTWSSVVYDEYAYIRFGIKSDGSLWAWGNDGYGRLGLGTVNVHRSSPVQIGSETDWVTVAMGASSAFAIKSNGTLWSWGRNYRGELGFNDLVARSSPTQVGTDTNWYSVSSWGDTVGAMKTDGTLWAWGYNYYGQLGQGDSVHRSSPVQIGSETDWETIDTSDQRMIATKTDGAVWGWGSYYYAGMGNGKGSSFTYSPVRISIDTNNEFLTIDGSNGVKKRI